MRCGKSTYRQLITTIYREDGMRGFTRGYKGMLLRDGPGFAIYFSAFGYLKSELGVSDIDREANYSGLTEY